MTSMLDSVKRPLVIGIASGVCCVAVILIWLRFPSAIPVVVLIAVGIVTALTFLVSEAIVVIRIVKTLVSSGPFIEDVRSLPHRAWLVLGALLVLCNGGLAYLSGFRSDPGYFLALNIAVVAAWAAAQIVGRRHLR